MLIPKFVLGIVIGASNSGKTNCIRNLLLQPNEQWLDYNRVYIFRTSLEQLKYRIIIKSFQSNLTKEDIIKIFYHQNYIKREKVDVFEHIEEAAKDVVNSDHEVETFIFEKSDDVRDPRTLDKQKNNLMIFDDLMMETNQNMCESYYTRRRHNNCDCFYLAQNYAEIPRHAIRVNCNFIIAFPQDDNDKRSIWKSFASTHMDFDEFKHFCNHVWKENYNFVTIDTTRTPTDGRYRNGLYDFYTPAKFVH